MQELLNTPLGQGIINFLIALAILIVGYIIARIVASVVRRLLERTGIDDRIANALTDGKEGTTFQVEEVVARVVFWIIMLFVIVAVLQRLNLPQVADPINSLLSQVTTVYLPQLGYAALLLAVAWALATVLKFLITRGAAMLRIDERLSEHAALEEGERVSVSDSLATAGFWFVFLLFLPAVLDALGVSQIAEPIQGMFAQVFDYIPNIFGAAITMLIGWFVARIIRQIVTNLLAALGIDNVGERVGLSGERSISTIIGTILYTFILLFTLISALDQLAIDAISDPATLMLNTIINAIPAVFGAGLVLTISYFIGRLISRLIVDLLAGVGFDDMPGRLGLNLSGGRTPSEWVGYIILVAAMLFAAISAAEMLGSAFLADILTTLIAFLGQVVMALIIFGIGLYLANMVHGVILSAGGDQANFGATVARMAILVLSGAMALRQLGVADDIVNMAFGILLGALGVAAALAFGLGSTKIAGGEVERFLGSIRSNDDDA
ncbi:MAG: mechanosensitive ion channel [Chloroflexota bacterium]